MQKSQELVAGFMVIHSNQMEQLRDLLVHWLRTHPLEPLEQDVILVQSNGMAQWLKYALASDTGLGIAAAMQVSLPASFLWKAYRTVLKDYKIDSSSPLDKSNLTWRLMRLLPQLLNKPEFLPLQRFLHNDDVLRKRYQLCERIADIFDQYQVYRTDWLINWAQGINQIDYNGERLQLTRLADVAEEDVQLQTLAWQSELWRALLEDIGEQAISSSRASVHPHFMETLSQATERPAGLPRRVVVFGISSLPEQMLQALAAIARFSQVILCVHNPCQYFWGDIASDRDIARRHQRKAGMPVLLTEEDLHQHAHPLLAAWGKQGRDYIALLNEHDSKEAYEAHFMEHQQQIDLFYEEEPNTLLTQLQSDILHLRPLSDSRGLWPQVDPTQDESIRFHIAHSPQREVEILHDQLLDRFARYPDLHPRDVIVMVPDIDHYAPHIQAVFGQFKPQEAGYLPFAVSDQGRRGQEPLLIALELLLQLPELRMTRAHIMTLLDVPALRARFKVQEDDLPLLQRWMEGAGIRWGLTGEQRSSFGLAAEWQQNTWEFGMQRMLAGYAMGEHAVLEGIEPYAEVAGLEAAALGPLYQLFRALCSLEQELREPQKPEQWVARLKQLLERFFLAEGQKEQLLIAQLHKALEEWRTTCAAGGFDEALPLVVMREAWLQAMEGARDSQRFLDGAINFCTLMPMRSIPFKLVCLLGMNDGDYPRSQPPLDFDLMRGSLRPGDRSRREDDRYLMLEAILAARRMLYISWVGRNVRDNNPRPPSVLVAQLKDHLELGWETVSGEPLEQALTCVHPLQPFSRAYFDGQNSQLFTYADEWLNLYLPWTGPSGSAVLPFPDMGAAISAENLFRFVRRPVQQFFAQRFKVYLELADVAIDDDEPFALDALAAYTTKTQLLESASLATNDDELRAKLQAEAERMQRSGELPLGSFGEQLMDELIDPLHAQLHAWLQRRATLCVEPIAPVALEYEAAGVLLETWLGGVYAEQSSPDALVAPVWVTGEIMRDNGKKQHWKRLLKPWFQHVLLHAAGLRATSEIYAETGCLRLLPLEQELAQKQLEHWLQGWLKGMCEPLPLAYETAMAWLLAADQPDKAAKSAAEAYEGGYQRTGERDNERVLQRQFPSFEQLSADGRFEELAQDFYALMLEHSYEYVTYAEMESMV